MVKVIVGLMGSAPSVNSPAISTPAGVTKFLDKCRRYNVNEVDTAAAYVNSERLLGEAGGLKEVIVSTKAPAFTPGNLAFDKVIAACNKSLRELKTDKVDIYYLHGPDHQTPIEEQCDAIGQLYKEGKFQRFGVSNVSPDTVRAMHNYCASKGYCLPKVYQVGYNPVQRAPETELFPLLRELNMNVYCYSPLAGGMFAKSIDQILQPGDDDRFKIFPVFQRYLAGETVPAMRELASKCDAAGITLLEATLRWFMHHSPLGDGDGFILGASKIEQLDGTLPLTKGGPLPDSLVEAFEQLWQQTKGNSAACIRDVNVRTGEERIIDAASSRIYDPEYSPPCSVISVPAPVVRSPCTSNRRLSALMNATLWHGALLLARQAINGAGRQDKLSGWRVADIIYVAIVGTVMLAAFLEWILWLAAFLYCLVKVFQKAENNSIRILAGTMMVFFTALRGIFLPVMIVTLPLPPKLTNEFPETMVTFLQWFAFWTFAGLLTIPWLFCVFQLVTHSVGRKRRIKHILDEDTAPKVVVVMPCYKEIPDILLRTVNSLVDCEYPPSCLHIFLSFDGDQEDELYLTTIEKLGVPMTLKTYPKSIDLAYRSTRVTVSRFPHGGKRHCQKQTFRLIEKIYTLYTQHHDDLFVLFIDSDCILDKVCIQNFMYEMELKPGSKRNMLAMTGVITSTTEKHSLLTILQDMEYIHGQLFERSVESACGAVTCLPGALTILRFSAFRKMAKYYFADKAEQCDDLFDYGKCHLGEDRWLTHLFMIGAKHRYQIQMNTGAFCKTEAVQDFRSLLKQRRRWFLGFITNEVCMLTDIRLWRQYPILCIVRFAQNTIRTTALLFFIMVIALITTSQKISQLPVGFIAVSLGLNWALMLYFAAKLGRYKIVLYPLMFVLNPFFNWLYMIYGIFTAGQRTWGGPRADAGAADTKTTPGAAIEHAQATGDDLNVIPETFKPALESVSRKKSLRSNVQPSQHVEGRFTASQVELSAAFRHDEENHVSGHEMRSFMPATPRRHSTESWVTTHTKQSIMTPRRVESFVSPADALAYETALALQPAAGGAFLDKPDLGTPIHSLNRARTVPLRVPSSPQMQKPPRVLQQSWSATSHSSSPLSSEPSSPELMPSSFNPYAMSSSPLLSSRGWRHDRNERPPFLLPRLEALSPTTEESPGESRLEHRSGEAVELQPLSAHRSSGLQVLDGPRSAELAPDATDAAMAATTVTAKPDRRPNKLRRRPRSSSAGSSRCQRTSWPVQRSASVEQQGRGRGSRQGSSDRSVQDGSGD